MTEVPNTSILHVEDEDSVAFLVKAALDEAAIPNRTYRVSTGEDALAYLNKSGLYKDAPSPGLILLDLNLPRVDGWTVLNTIKRHEELHHIPVVVLSSSVREDDRARALEMGADNFVVKENSVHAIRRALLEACSNLLSFHMLRESAPAYVLRSHVIAFDRTIEQGVEVNRAVVLAEGARLKLIGTEASNSSAYVRHGSQALWMSLHDLRDHAYVEAEEILTV